MSKRKIPGKAVKLTVLIGVAGLMLSQSHAFSLPKFKWSPGQLLTNAANNVTATVQTVITRVAAVEPVTAVTNVAQAIASGPNAIKYFTWQSVTPAVSTGAACANGSPYRFFVNRTPLTSRTVVYFEGGGACWNQKDCTPGGGMLSGSNPNGVPEDYATNYPGPSGAEKPQGLGPILGLAYPLIARVHPLQQVQTQSWNFVFVPYCTADVHMGNKVNVYSESDPSKPLTRYHRGHPNAKAVAAWLSENLRGAEVLVVTGNSAGGYGATVNYATIRDAVQPKRSSLLNDSGEIFYAPEGGSIEQYPSLGLHTEIRKTWGLDAPSGILADLAAKYPPARALKTNFGLATQILADYYPKDRFGHITFRADRTIPNFSYRYFVPEVMNAPDDKARDAAITRLFNMELVQNYIPYLQSRANIGYYMPYGRLLNVMGSHTMLTGVFWGTSINELGISDVGKFVDNIIDGSGVPMRAYEYTDEPQPTRLDGWLLSFLDQLAAGQ